MYLSVSCKELGKEALCNKKKKDRYLFCKHADTVHLKQNQIPVISAVTQADNHFG